MLTPRPHASQTHTANGPTVPLAVREGAGNPGGVTFVRPDRTERFYSFARLAEEVDQRALRLRAAGLAKGDRVGLILPDNEEFVLTFLAALNAGVVPVPMYPPMSLGRLDGYMETAARILSAAEAKALVCDQQVQPVLWSLTNRVHSLEHLLVSNRLPDATGEPIDLGHIALDDVAFLQFTSGSTAEPKGVVVTHRSLLANLDVIMRHGLQITPEDVAVSWLPLYHDMGLIGFLLAPMWYSVPTVYLPTLSFVKHPTLWMQTIHKHRGSIAFAPNFAYALATRRTNAAELARLDLSCVKALGCGAEPNHPATLRRFLAHFAPAGLKPTALLPCYGMAEATLAMTFNPLGRGLRTDRIDADAYQRHGAALPADEKHGRPTLEFVSCGRPLPGHDVHLVNEHGHTVGERQVGEIVFSGRSIAAGYFNRMAATAEVFRPEGLRTGDLGYLADGELFVTGRKKDLLILNGRNYDPQTVEWQAAEVPGIRKGNVVAFTRPGADTEELVIVAESRESAARARLGDEVRRHVQAQLCLVAADVVLVGPGELPKTSSGKLQRARTRQQYLDGTLGRAGVRTLGGRAQAWSLAKHLSWSFLARMQHSVKRRTRRFFSGRAGAGDTDV